jgi:beta-phosphoglucomutase
VIKAILFDFDGVLAETFSSHVAAWTEVFGEQGISIHPEVVYMNEGAPAWKIGQAIAIDAGANFSKKKLKKIARRKNEIFRAKNTAVVYDGVLDIIDLSKRRGLKVALVTGTALANLQAVLPDSLLNAFDEIVKDGDTKRGKPHPDPYLKAAEKLKIRTSECLVLENAPLGIRSAKSAGAFCVALMTTLPEDRLTEADVVVKGHRAVLDMFDELLDYKTQ